jgi:hypothetical protein
LNILCCNIQISFGNIRFRHVIMDYFRTPSAYSEDMWSERFYRETLVEASKTIMDLGPGADILLPNISSVRAGLNAARVVLGNFFHCEAVPAMMNPLSEATEDSVKELIALVSTEGCTLYTYTNHSELMKMGDPPFLRLVRTSDACPSPFGTVFFLGKSAARSSSHSAAVSGARPMFSSSLRPSGGAGVSLHGTGEPIHGKRGGHGFNAPPFMPSRDAKARALAASEAAMFSRPQPKPRRPVDLEAQRKREEALLAKEKRREEMAAKMNLVLAERIKRGGRISKPPAMFDPGRDLRESQMELAVTIVASKRAGLTAASILESAATGTAPDLRVVPPTPAVPASEKVKTKTGGGPKAGGGGPKTGGGDPKKTGLPLTTAAAPASSSTPSAPTAEGAKGKKPKAGDADADGRSFEKGARINGRYNKGPIYYKGVVTKKHPSGTYDLLYDDGDTEFRVAPRWIKAVVPRKRKVSQTVTTATTVTVRPGGRQSKPPPRFNPALDLRASQMEANTDIPLSKRMLVPHVLPAPPAPKPKVASGGVAPFASPSTSKHLAAAMATAAATGTPGGPTAAVSNLISVQIHNHLQLSMPEDCPFSIGEVVWVLAKGTTAYWPGIVVGESSIPKAVIRRLGPCTKANRNVQVLEYPY